MLCLVQGGAPQSDDTERDRISARSHRDEMSPQRLRAGPHRMGERFDRPVASSVHHVQLGARRVGRTDLRSISELRGASRSRRRHVADTARLAARMRYARPRARRRCNCVCNYAVNCRVEHAFARVADVSGGAGRPCMSHVIITRALRVRCYSTRTCTNGNDSLGQ